MPSSLSRSFILAAVVATTWLMSASPASAKSCSLAGKQRSLGATYVTQLSVTGTSCASAERVVKAYHACRFRRGRAGTCGSTVRTFRCRERRSNVISTQFDAKVTCQKTGARILHSYTQFT